jgi:hypothetical protein
MDYSKVIPLMEYIAKNITKLYKKWGIWWKRKKIWKKKLLMSNQK